MTELNGQHNLATTPAINNNGESYIVPFDIYKEGYDAYDISNWFKARVGDNGIPFGIRWYKHGQLMDVTGMRPFIEGQVGDYTIDDSNPDDPKINMDSEASNVHVVGEVNDCQEYGVAIYRLINQAMPQSGIFYGKFGVMGTQDDGTTVMSSVDVVFKVLAGHMNMIGARQFYVSEFEKALLEFQEKLKKHDQDYQQQLDANNLDFKNQTEQIITDARSAYINQVQNSQDAITALDSEVKSNRAELTNINDHLSGVEQQIAIHDIVTIPQHTEDLKNISNAIDERLANVKTAPVAVENAQVLQQRYPNGADGIFITADTGHKWLWLSGAWADCGEYQAIGIGDELIQPIKQQQVFDEQNIATNYSLINENSGNIKENTVHLQEVQGAGQYTEIHLTDQNGRHITNEVGASIVGNKWLPMVDKTLTQSDLPADAKAVGDAIASAESESSVKPEDYGIPVLYLWGDNIPSLKKGSTLEHQVTYKFPKYHIQGTLDNFEVNGQTSALLAKKNYSLDFDQSFVAFPNYGKQHHYIIEANMTDFTESRTNVNMGIWSQLRATHCQVNDAIQDKNGNYLVDDRGNHIIGEADPQLSIGGAYGTGEAFPIAVYINDKYWGLYSLNFPIDGWTAKMPKKQGYGIIDAIWTDAGAFTSQTNLNDGIALEFCGTKNADWLKAAINQVIDALIAHYDTKDAFDHAIADLLDLDSAIDYYIYSVLIGNVDGVYRNFLLQTFNGKKFYIVAYDLDETFGRSPQSFNWIKPDLVDNDDFWHYGLTFENFAKNNRLMYQLWKFHKDDILNRLKYLLDNEMSLSSVEKDYQDYLSQIPFALNVAEAKRWPQRLQTSNMTLGQIWRWYNQRVTNIKTKYLENETDEISQLKAKINSIQQAILAK